MPVAIPLSFVSHFALDALPHYGVNENAKGQSGTFKTIVFVDTVFALLLLAVAVGHHKWKMITCGVIAYSPDVTLVYQYFKNGRSLDVSHIKGPLTNFHVRIQFERPWGIFTELLVTAFLLPLFFVRLSS